MPSYVGMVNRTPLTTTVTIITTFTTPQHIDLSRRHQPAEEIPFSLAFAVSTTSTTMKSKQHHTLWSKVSPACTLISQWIFDWFNGGFLVWVPAVLKLIVVHIDGVRWWGSCSDIGVNWKGSPPCCVHRWPVFDGSISRLVECIELFAYKLDTNYKRNSFFLEKEEEVQKYVGWKYRLHCRQWSWFAVSKCHSDSKRKSIFALTNCNMLQQKNAIFATKCTQIISSFLLHSFLAFLDERVSN